MAASTFSPETQIFSELKEQGWFRDTRHANTSLTRVPLLSVSLPIPAGTFPRLSMASLFLAFYQFQSVGANCLSPGGADHYPSHHGVTNSCCTAGTPSRSSLKPSAGALQQWTPYVKSQRSDCRVTETKEMRRSAASRCILGKETDALVWLLTHQSVPLIVRHSEVN